MKILAYEFVTGGGLWWDTADARPSNVGSSCAPLLDEGRAMIDALLEDLAKLDGVQLVCFQDSRFASSVPDGVQVVRIASDAERLAQLGAWAARVDGVIVIAPELDGLLLRDCRLVQQHGGTLWSPAPAFVALASNKTDAADRLARGGVSCPEGLTLMPGQPMPVDFPYPAVVKRVDGAGSTEMRTVSGPDAASTRAARPLFRLERFQPGMPVSVAALCGRHGPVLLPACRQHISNDDRFQYLGGRLPLDPARAERAAHLARMALNVLPATNGYVGIDMVLGPDPSGRDDVVVDVNPRLTTSYVGMRRAARCNLADAMIRLAQGQMPSGPIPFEPTPIEFDCRGNVL